jgi:glycosyltransferase involved in cell wall biosynthesis
MEFKMSNPKISVLLLTQNNENSIRRTLESIKGFDEIVVVDGGSIDGTKKIVGEYPNAVFYENPWPGFIEQRNFSISKASHDWCFMIDSDEELCSDTKIEIDRIVSLESPAPMYRIMRTEYYLGTALETGFGKSDYQERLFLKSRVRYTGGVHHNHTIDGELVTPDSPGVENFPRCFRIKHDEDYGMDDWLTKFPRFTVLIANEKMSRGRKVGGLTVFISFIGTFLQIFFKSFKEGKLGFVLAMQEAIYRTMVKLYIYQSQNFDRKTSNELKQKLG